MSLFDQIIAVYPELTSDDFGMNGKIILQDDLDAAGEFISAWNYSKPIPSGMKLGK